MTSEWKLPKEEMPPYETVVLCQVEHFHSKNIQEHELIHVNKDDHDWVTADDRSELDEWSWTVVGWRHIEPSATAV